MVFSNLIIYIFGSLRQRVWSSYGSFLASQVCLPRQPRSPCLWSSCWRRETLEKRLLPREPDSQARRSPPRILIAIETKRVWYAAEAHQTGTVRNLLNSNSATNSHIRLVPCYRGISRQGTRYRKYWKMFQFTCICNECNGVVPTSRLWVFFCRSWALEMTL